MIKPLAITLAALSVTLAASGCTTVAQIDAGIGQQLGKPISSAMLSWGHPSSVDSVGQDKYYTWSDNSQGSIPIYSTASTTGYVSGQYVNLSTPTTTMIPVRYSCDRTLVANPSGTVIAYSWRGNNCGAYALK